jgi:hypothetical protein
MINYWVCATSSDIEDSPYLFRKFQGNICPSVGAGFMVRHHNSTVKMMGHYAPDSADVVYDMVFINVNREVFNLLQADESWSASRPKFLPPIPK